MAYFWLLYAFLLNLLVILTASDPSNSCEKTLSLCSLQVGGVNGIRQSQTGPKGQKGDFGDPGEKGKPGRPGLIGFPGEDGTPGRNGYLGIDGPPGLPGIPGPKGMQGSDGFQGRPGEKGVRGDLGSEGDSGPMGNTGPVGISGIPGYSRNGPPGFRGVEGDMGIPGPIGPPGPPGENGHCPCSYPEPRLTGDFGNITKPAKVVCKASMMPVKTGEYYIGPGPIKVKCVNRPHTTTLTCIPPVATTPKTYTYEKKLWLSQKGLTIEEIYGINRNQLAWLQASSSSAFQTIRYHCFNSIPFPRDNVNNSLLLLSWNDNTIGPMPTLTKPFFYTVLPETDGCSNASENEWNQTDIKLVSTGIRRVPITDFFIRDIRDGRTQSVKIEHVELCFD